MKKSDDFSGEQSALPGFAPIPFRFIPRPGSIASLLGRGEGAAVTTAELAEELCCDPRAVTISVYRERRAGVPVCSGQSGFFLPVSETEVTECVRGLRRRAKEIADSADALESAWAAAGGAVDGQ